MAIKNNKILAYVSTLKKFQAALEIFGSDYYDNSVVFIEDTQQIYTHGTYFDGGGINWSVLKEGILSKGEDRFNIVYCSKEDFEQWSEKSKSVLSIVNYIVTGGKGALGMNPGDTFVGTRFWKGDTLLRLIMDEMLLENEIVLDNTYKIYPDTFPGVIMQLFNIFKNFGPIEPDTDCSCIWGDLDSGQVIPDGKCACSWGDLDLGTSSSGDDCCIWNDLDAPVTTNEIFWGDTEINNSSSATLGYDSTWGDINTSNSSSGSGSSWNELLFRLLNNK